MSAIDLTLSQITVGLSLFFLFIFLLTTLLNLLFFPRLERPIGEKAPSQTIENSKRKNTKLSICIPARNEAEVIERTVRQLLADLSGNERPSLKKALEIEEIELLILDDQSTDKTQEIVESLVEQDQRIRLLQGRVLPAGWLGKNWACHQLAAAASGDVLLFCDADVTVKTGGLTALLAEWQNGSADLLTVWPTQQTGSWAEWLVVPLMKFTIISYLPTVAVHYLTGPIGVPFAAANGQLLLFKRAVYDDIDGHAGIRHKIVEDIAFAKRIKKEGYRLRMMDGGCLISCRMYRNWESVRSGFGKNILAGHGDSPLALAVSTGFHWLLYLAPWLFLFSSDSNSSRLALLAISITIFMRALGERFFGRPWGQAFLSGLFMPISVILMTAIAWQGLRWHFGTGPEWKGRVLTVNSK